MLRENGYAGFTLETVASRASTSRPVIARPWANRHELLHATIAHVGARREDPAPDTKSVRGDLIALLRRANGAWLDLATMVGVQLGGYYQETGKTLADLREVLIGGHELLRSVAASVDCDLCVGGQVVAAIPMPTTTPSH
ncbi:TetR/AcrR family transcriptional regulator [Streptomyces silvisoli]|uniref:TetR family transcriptional regulator n=1 Tax=Streptomyces silvisoli TaxID=3034235 RepID=A0ABT5ZLH1_9ACTN|nr:TetR family transcriptional regulator [Streptomyces silvisoli]MDF3290672.1 TetR family transcriptional regulator [Streptomyces silvisoli]